MVWDPGSCAVPLRPHGTTLYGAAVHADSLAAVTAWWTALGVIAAALWSLVRGRRALGALPAEELALLGAVLVGAVVAAARIPAYQRIYTDEAYYMLAGSELRAHAGWVADLGYAKSYGWPALLGLSFSLGPRDPATAVLLSQLLRVLSLVLVYGCGAVWAGPAGRRAGLVGALLLGLSPIYALLARTVEANVAGVFTLTLMLLAGGLWRREAVARHGVLLAASTALACMTRPEGAVLAAVLAAAHLRTDRRLVALVLAGVGLALPNLWVYAAMHVTNNVDRIAAFGVAAARLHPARAFVSGPYQSVVATLAVAGLAVGWRGARGPALALAAWLLLTLALLSAAGTGALALPDRFVLAPNLPAALLAGHAAQAALTQLATRSRHAAIALALLATLWVARAARPGLDAEQHPNAGYALQHRLAEQVEAVMPAHCTLVATRPELYQATTDLTVLSAPDVLSGTTPLPACARFIWDMTCSEWHWPPFSDQCAALRAMSRPTPLTTFPSPIPWREGDEGEPGARDALLLDLSPDEHPTPEPPSPPAPTTPPTTD